MSKAAAKRMEGTIYGDNFMIPFDTEEAYLRRLAELNAQKKATK
jgi:hypothetical protein